MELSLGVLSLELFAEVVNIDAIPTSACSVSKGERDVDKMTGAIEQNFIDRSLAPSCFGKSNFI